jgi:hypothetical protein
MAGMTYIKVDNCDTGQSIGQAKLLAFHYYQIRRSSVGHT